MSVSRLSKLALSVFAASAFAYAPARATTTINVAVAPNFAYAMSAIVAAFEAKYPGTNITYTLDSTGNLTTDIENKSPQFDLFLSADLAHVTTLVTSYPSLVVASTKKLYAVGSLELWSPTVNISAGLPYPLTTDIVIANPAKAPYGAAAAAVLASSPWSIPTSSLPSTYVSESPNIGTTYAAIAAGSYEYGFIAQSYICKYNATTKAETFSPGYHYSYLYNNTKHPYSELTQYLIEVVNPSRTAAQNTVLTEFVDYLTGVGTTAGTAIIQSYCYKLTA
jgi:molybdate transport system substrate-binding protein